MSAFRSGRSSPNEDLPVLAERLHELEVSNGSYVIQQGDLSYKFYVILKGTAAVEREGEHLADHGPGDFFGEVGIVGHSWGNADVVTTSSVRRSSWVYNRGFHEPQRSPGTHASPCNMPFP